jgi:hypothetical protein
MPNWPFKMPKSDKPFSVGHLSFEAGLAAGTSG